MILRPACPGIVKVVDEAGAPLAGAALPRWRSHGVRSARSVPDGSRSWRTDSRGEVFMTDRPCGSTSFEIWHRESGPIPAISAEIQGGEPKTRAVPPAREGTLHVVDLDGQPVDAEASPYHQALSLERLGAGVFQIRSRRASETVAIRAEGYPAQHPRVPIDGGEHLIALADDGSFRLRGVPPGTAEIALDLYSPQHGLFRAALPIPETNRLPTWEIRWEEEFATTPLYDASAADTGEPAGDTGVADTGLEADTGAPPDTSPPPLDAGLPLP